MEGFQFSYSVNPKINIPPSVIKTEPRFEKDKTVGPVTRDSLQIQTVQLKYNRTGKKHQWNKTSISI